MGSGKNDGLSPSTLRLNYEVDFSPLLSVRITDMLKLPAVVIGENFSSEVPVIVMKESLGYTSKVTGHPSGSENDGSV